MAENYSLHMPARKAAAAARWGPVLCEEDRGIGRTFWCIMPVWRQRGGVCVCVCVCVVVFVPMFEPVRAEDLTLLLCLSS